MENKYVDGKMLVGDIITKYPETAEVLLKSGMHCLGCPASRAESLEDACEVHEIDVEEVLEKVNNRIAETRK